MKRPSETFQTAFSNGSTKPKSRSCANKISPEIVGRILVSDIRRSLENLVLQTSVGFRNPLYALKAKAV